MDPCLHADQTAGMAGLTGFPDICNAPTSIMTSDSCTEAETLLLSLCSLPPWGIAQLQTPLGAASFTGLPKPSPGKTAGNKQLPGMAAPQAASSQPP